MHVVRSSVERGKSDLVGEGGEGGEELVAFKVYILLYKILCLHL